MIALLADVLVQRRNTESFKGVNDLVGVSTTSIAFGGPERHTLFVTDSTHGNVLTYALDTPGVVLHGLPPPAPDSWRRNDRSSWGT